MFLLFFLALAAADTSVFVPLDGLKGHATLYEVGKSSKVYIISNAPTQVLQTFSMNTKTGGQNGDVYTLSVPQSDGSLTPFTPSLDDDILRISSTDSVTSVPGYLYITNLTNLNVYPLSENSTVNFKQGTNVFFRMESPNMKIPVARNVFINKNVQFSGYVGRPDLENRFKFFDSSLLDETNYSQLDLPMDIFHFASNGVDVQYKVQFGPHVGMNVGQSGLLMTNDFPGGEPVNITDFEITNPNNANISVLLFPVFNKQSYSVNVTLFSMDAPLQTISLFSQNDSNVDVVVPVTKFRFENGGPWAVQYSLRDTTTTTPTPVELTTKASSLPQLLVSLLLTSVLFRF